MDVGRCSHIGDLFADETVKQEVLQKYGEVVGWSVHRAARAATSPAKRKKLASPTCSQCESPLARPFACLHCEFIGCWEDNHITEHLSDDSHLLCVDARSGEVICIECDDVIYETVLEDVHKSAVNSSVQSEIHFQVGKKRREPYIPWNPTPTERVALEGAVSVACEGRRGLLNLGQTCFLNVVLQSLIHNPLLRNYFMSDKHNQLLCKTKDCTCCEMDALYSEVYSGSSSPFGPASFLATMWRASTELAGYAQQDAHECLISVLNQIHSTSRGSTNVSCNCVVHTTFAGQLQSDVRCGRCGNITTTVDPMLDVSLELRGKGGDIPVENTLAGCLRRFTQPEDSVQGYTCTKCKTSHEATKRMSIKKLPPVLCFQLKRFEHKSADKSTAQKIDARVRLPATLNMLQYTTLAMTLHDKENNKGGKSFPSKSANLGPGLMYDYDLFTVICHDGQMDNGHYYNFAQFKSEWYRFEDEKITQSTLGAALDAQAYMCFYVKRHLDYQPYLTPTYIRAREVEARREEEREREREAARTREVDDALLATL